MSLAKMASMTRAFPNNAFSGIGGVTDFRQAVNYFLLGCGTVQVCTAAMLDSAVGPNVIRNLINGLSEFMEQKGYRSIEEFRGIRRDRIVLQSQIRRPEKADYHGGYSEEFEGYSKPVEIPASA
jgi:dihydroorotate dehydrogenase